MLDPTTAISIASAAYSAIQSAISHGKNIEDMGTTLSKWAGAISDLNFAAEKAKNPPAWKVLMGADEAQAIEIFAAQKKAQRMRKDLMVMIGYAYGPKGQEEYIAILRQIRKQRKETVYRREEIKENILSAVVFLAVMGIGITAMVSGLYLITH